MLRYSSLALEPLAGELQGSAIFSNSANDLIRRAGWNFRLDLKRHLHGRADKSSEVCDNFVGNPTCISSHARGIEVHSTVEPFWIRV
jgi:hypothetical protein